MRVGLVLYAECVFMPPNSGLSRFTTGGVSSYLLCRIFYEW